MTAQVSPDVYERITLWIKLHILSFWNFGLYMYLFH